MKSEIKALIIISSLLFLSIITNVYLLGKPSGDSAEQIRLYEELNRKSDITEGLLRDNISRAEEDLNTARVVSDELRKTVGTLQESNARRERLDKISSSLGGKTRVAIVEGITRIDSGEEKLRGLQEAERGQRQALEGLLGSE